MKWRSHEDSNLDQGFRKAPLYPVQLWDRRLETRPIREKKPPRILMAFNAKTTTEGNRLFGTIAALQPLASLLEGRLPCWQGASRQTIKKDYNIM